MLAVIVFFFQCPNDDLKMVLIIKEIGIAHIYKKRFDIMLLDVLYISFLKREEVFIRYVLLVGTIALFDIALQF